MLELIIAWVKALPLWLSHTVEVIIVVIATMTAMTLLAGIWIGLLVVKKRSRSIESVSLIPFRIEFREDTRQKVPPSTD